MNNRTLIAGIVYGLCALSAHAQDSIADSCAEFLAPDQWPEPMSEDERSTLEASIRETLTPVSELIGQLSDASELTAVDVAEPGESTESRIEYAGNDYASIDNWQNPIVAITVEGVEVSSGALENGSLYAPVGALQCILTNLPVSAWPHGRVVRAGPPSLVSFLADMVPISRNREAVEAIFDELQIEVLWWVS